MQVYLVGGAVRDELLGGRPPDRDYVVIGATEVVFLRTYPGAKKVGRRDHCVYIHRGREFTLSDQPDIWADLERRDLTINAAAKDEQGRILATERTRRDLKNKVLRPVHPDNFRDDPLRCYRAARMAACFPEFAIHHELEDVLRDMAGSEGLERIAAERVCEEVRKACSCLAPGRFLRVLAEHDLFASWFSELAFLREHRNASSADPDLPGPASAADRLNRLQGDPLRVWMGMCSLLDAAAPPESSETRNSRAAAMARTMAQRLRMPLVFIRAAEKAAGWIRAATRYNKLSPEARVDLLTDLATHELNERMLAVAAAVSPDVDPRAWRDDLRRMDSVCLPPEKQGLGPESGRILRRMRCESLRKG
jgi:tRNA nucleotidyltransferase (CCA-adding enzyme)